MPLIPGTSSIIHLKENLAAASLALPNHIVRKLDQIGSETSGQPEA